MSAYNRVLVFGVFDLLHDGHRYFLTSARKLGKKLIVAVAPDSVVLELKDKMPTYSEIERIQNLKITNLSDEVVIGDASLSTWNIIMRTKPDLVALGYDQAELKEVLQFFLERNGLSVDISILPPFEDGSLHSSSLRKSQVAIPS